MWHPLYAKHIFFNLTGYLESENRWFTHFAGPNTETWRDNSYMFHSHDNAEFEYKISQNVITLHGLVKKSKQEILMNSCK